jgi:hypothetical protein
MRLVIDPDPSWPLRSLGSQRFAVLGDNALLAWGPLVEYPDDIAAWHRRALAVELPAGGTLAILATEPIVTRSGWRGVLVEALVEVGDVREYRLGAFFRFLEHGAVALVRSESPIAARDVIRAALATARPDWTDGAPTCLRDCVSL